MPDVARDRVARTVRAGQRIGRAPGREDHRVEGKIAVLGQNPRGATVFHADPGGFRPEETTPGRIAKKRRKNIRAPVRLREDATSALGFEFYAEFGQQVLHILRGKAVDRRKEETRVFRHVVDEFGGGAVVGHVAPPFARNEDLFPRTVVLLDDGHARTGAQRRTRGEKPRRAAPDHGDVLFVRFSCRRHIRPRPVPDGRSVRAPRSRGVASRRREARR